MEYIIGLQSDKTAIFIIMRAPRKKINSDILQIILNIFLLMNRVEKNEIKNPTPVKNLPGS